MTTAPYITWFLDLDTESEHYGKASLHLARLAQAKFPLVPGFVITTHAYYDFLRLNNLDYKIKQLLSTVAFDRADSLMQVEFHIKRLFDEAMIAQDFVDELFFFYDQLGDAVQIEVFETEKQGKKHTNTFVDEPEELIEQIINLWAEMFTAKALWRRHHHNIHHFTTGAEIIVQKKIYADKTGTIFTVHPQTLEKDKLIIVTEKPHSEDKYILSKKTLTILDRELKHKTRGEKLTLDEILGIAKMGKKLEEHLYFPQVISWIIEDNKLYIAEVKPMTESVKLASVTSRKLPLARGKGVTPLIGTGVAIIHPQTSLAGLNAHSIIIVPDLKPTQVKNLKKLRGIVIENNPHPQTAAFLKSHGIPAICNVKHATKHLRNGHIITVNGAKGEIYPGGFF